MLIVFFSCYFILINQNMMNHTYIFKRFCAFSFEHILNIDIIFYIFVFYVIIIIYLFKFDMKII